MNDKMTLVQIILGSVVLVLCVVAIVCISAQQGKSNGLGAMAGSSSEMDTFFNKNKSRTKDSILAKITVVITVILVLCILALNFTSLAG